MKTRPDAPRIQSLFRYPIKGFAGEELESAWLAPRRGFPMDRAFAISDGSWNYDPATFTWKQKREFLALMTQPRLARVGVRLNGIARTFEIRIPGFPPMVVKTGDLPEAGAPVIDALIEYLGLPGTPRPAFVAGSENQFTDLAMLNGPVHKQFHSGISLINLASMREVGDGIGGAELDPLRFRANIYYDSPHPWEEREWVGKVVRIGEAVGKVLMATPRCAVPSVNPSTGEKDAPIVQTLMKRYRNIDLGFYIDIMQPGRIAPGDVLQVEEDHTDAYVEVEVPLNGVNYKTFARRTEASKTGAMQLVVESVASASDRATKCVLASEDSSVLPSFVPGAHIRLRVPIGGRTETRCYSLTNFIAQDGEPRRYEIGIQRESAGRGGSVWLCDNLAPGARVHVEGPFEGFSLEPSDAPALFIAGGIGITPILSMARACQYLHRPFTLHFLARDIQGAPFLDEVRALRGGTIQLHLGLEPLAARKTVRDSLLAAAATTSVHACGPAGLLDSVLQAARDLNWDPARIRYERFSASTSAEDRPFVAQLAHSGIQVTVGAGESLLQALRRSGVSVPSSCGAGICGSCLVPVLSGEVAHRDTFLEPQDRVEGKLMCACVSRAAGEFIALDL